MTKFDALKLSRDQVMTLETWLKIYTNVCNYVTASPKTINSLKYFSVFLLNCKIGHASTTRKELIRKSLCLSIFRNITEVMKKIKSLYGFGGCCHKITDVCMDL